MVKRIAALVVGSFVLMACGPGAKIGGKQGAAEALYAASAPSSGNANSATPVDLAGFNWNCPHGGKASFGGAGFTIGVGSGAGVNTDLTLKYENCGIAKSDVGVAIYNGSMTFGQNVQAGGSSVSVDQNFKGKITVTGAYDDFIDADVRQQIAVGDLGTTGKGVSMTLVGRITTSEGDFNFNEAITVTGGTISAKVSTQN